MRVVVDANIVAAAAVRPDGWTSLQMERTDMRFYAPDLVREELQEHSAELALRADCTPNEWRTRVQRLLRGITLIPTNRLARHRNHPMVRRVERVDPDDVAYIACMLEVDAQFLWTRDSKVWPLFQGIAGPDLPNQ